MQQAYSLVHRDSFCNWYYWLTALMLHLFGYSMWAVRLINPLLSWIGVLFTYFCCGFIYNSRRIAFISAALVGTAFLYIAMGRILTLDCGVAFFLNVSLLSFLVGLQYTRNIDIIGHRWKRTCWFLLAYIAAGCAVMTKGLIGIVFPIMVIGLWVMLLNQWKQVRYFHIIIGLIIVLLIAAPWVILVQKHYPFFAYYYFIRQRHIKDANATNTHAALLMLFCFKNSLGVQ